MAAFFIYIINYIKSTNTPTYNHWDKLTMRSISPKTRETPNYTQLAII
jgi:hypothetical protein